MITLRPYQQECESAFYSYHESGKGRHGLIVVPTAGGKSLIIGSLITNIVKKWPTQRILVLSHVQELIKQNHVKIGLCWSAAPAGIYSAALKKRQGHMPIVSATIQSVYKKANILGHRDIVAIDEAHLLNSEGTGMYNELIKDLLAINPNLIVVGFTATEYRLDSGPLTEGDNALFDGVIIEISMSRLLEEGYLTPPISKGSLVQADLDGVKITAGEYNTKQMAERFDGEAFIKAALDNDMPFLHDRRSIGTFASTLQNAEHIVHGLRERGIDAEIVDGEMPADLREQRFEDFRQYKLRALVSVGVMTTGTDLPNMDAILLFRATKSPGLYQQIIGRGFRVMYANGYDLDTQQGRLDAIRNGVKPNFLVLDHGGNIERHGPITAVAKPERREKGQRRQERQNGRICEICRTGHPLEVTICTICGYVMLAPRDDTAALDAEASDADVLGSPFSRGEVAQWFTVDDVRYGKYTSMKNLQSMKVTYYSGIMQFNEWIKPHHGHWWSKRAATRIPDNLDDMIAKSPLLLRPKEIQVRKNKKNFDIVNYRFHMPLIEEVLFHEST